mmetsp:Transcript_66980/g.195826  ORF Transcript_66980/g.195826 Transcript_66980/m.195826 type:complete len:240 (-) Transcript_66980:136-855(-)
MATAGYSRLAPWSPGNGEDAAAAVGSVPHRGVIDLTLCGRASLPHAPRSTLASCLACPQSAGRLPSRRSARRHRVHGSGGGVLGAPALPGSGGGLRGLPGALLDAPDRGRHGARARRPDRLDEPLGAWRTWGRSSRRALLLGGALGAGRGRRLPAARAVGRGPREHEECVRSRCPPAPALAAAPVGILHAHGLGRNAAGGDLLARGRRQALRGPAARRGCAGWGIRRGRRGAARLRQRG